MVFGLSSTGAQDDFASATELAGRMVREWGMSDKLPHISWAPRGPVFLGEDLMHTRDYSDETAYIIDQEISRILDEQAARAHQVLEQHRHALDALASALFTHESLEGSEVATITDAADREDAQVGPLGSIAGSGPGKGRLAPVTPHPSAAGGAKRAGALETPSAKDDHS